jgi:hypothetical protein
VGRSLSGDGDGAPAVPAVYRGTEGRPGPLLFTLDVDAVRHSPSWRWRHAYDWLSVPNKGYGFGSSGTPNRSVEEHRESIRAFLAMIDPNTGHERVVELALPARSWPVPTPLGQRHERKPVLADASDH